MENKVKGYNIDLISQKATDIRRARRMLDRYAAMTTEEFLNNDTVISAAKYQLVVGAEAAQAICNHIVARVAERIPDSYSDCYMILGESGVIDWPLAERLSALANFRDLLIHQYGEINNERVYAIILKDLQDLDLFLTRVSLFIGAKRT